MSVASDRYTLPAGTWLIRWQAPGATTGGSDTQHQSWLYNFTDSAVVARGGSCYLDGGSNVSAAMTDSFGAAVVTIATSKAFEIRDRATGIGGGGGALVNLGTEVYTRVEIYCA